MRGCQNIEIVISGKGTGSVKLYMPTRRLPVWHSGTMQIRSEVRARASAAEKPPTIAAISRPIPADSRASSMGPFSSPRRETTTCRPAA